jgi:hypothetical protein
MSYNVRDDGGLFGPLAGVEIPNGASQSTVVAHQLMEPVGMFGVAGGTVFPAGILAATTYTVYISPPNPSSASGIVPLGAIYRVLGVQVFYSTAAAGAATIAIEIVPPGTANGSGTNVLSATNYALNTALTTANTPQALALNANIDNLTLAPNSRINVITGATSTASLVDFTLAIYVARIS